MKKEIDFSKVEITENSLFTKVLSVEEIVKDFLKLILDIDVVKINKIVREEVFDDLDGSKDIRLDLYVEDDNTVYDIDVQTGNQYDLPKRTRYYQSKIDRRYLHKGDKTYNKLRKSYIIFVCTFNPFKTSKTNFPIYIFENMFINDNKVIKLNDMAYKVFVNAECDVNKIKDNNLKSFIELINDGYMSQSKSKLTDKMIDEANQIRHDGKWRVEYMTMSEILREEARQEGRQQGIQEGIQEGRQEAKINMVIEMLKHGADDNFILLCSKLEHSELEEIKKQLNK